MQFEDILIGAGEDEFGNMCGFAPFPYFQRNIEVTCEDGVTPEYAAKSLQWLAQVDEALIREICQYACYYLQDTLERTSVGELLDEEIQHIQDPMEILRYMDLGMLHISEPLDPGIPVLNLSGGCDWREDEGLQCLIREGRTVYLGSWSDLDIWRSPCLGEENYLFNYIYYPRRDELRARTAERLAEHPVKVIPHLEIPMSSPPAAFYRGSLRPAGGLFGGGSLGQNREYPAVRVPARIPASDGGKRSLPAPLLLHGTRSGTRRNGPVPGGALRHLLNAKKQARLQDDSRWQACFSQVSNRGPLRSILQSPASPNPAERRSPMEKQPLRGVRVP